MISEGPKMSPMVRDQKLEIAYIYGWECCAEVKHNSLAGYVTYKMQ
jgi:hypothetical protein